LRRQETEARQLADLTGWNLAGIRAQMNRRTLEGEEKWCKDYGPVNEGACAFACTRRSRKRAMTAFGLSI
jgi:hypothetical protein